jgi:hypothetical protein
LVDVGDEGDRHSVVGMRAAAHVFESGGGSGSEGGGIGDCWSNSQMMDVDAHGPVRPASACDSDILPTFL